MKKYTPESLAGRMKQYEGVTDTRLVPKMPIVIRLDGKAFRTYTKGLTKPFDVVISTAMIKTAKALCEDVHTCVFGYTQSDEITLILKLYDRIKAEPYYDGRLEKIVSLTASKATRYFNKFFTEEVGELNTEVTDESVLELYHKKAGNAEFACVACNIPEWDCINNIIWRQQDAIRNSVLSVGYANYSPSELHKVNTKDLKEKLLNEKGINWDEDFSSYQKMGACLYKKVVTKEVDGEEVKRRYWECDYDTERMIQNERAWFEKVTGLSEK